MNELKQIFLNSYFNISKLAKKVWKYLVTLAKKFRHVFPSQQVIAEHCRCSRITINRILKKFVEFGWLSQINRCYRSSEYFLDESLLDVDLEKDTVYNGPPHTENVTQKDTQHVTQKDTLSNESKTIKPVGFERLSKTGIVQDFQSKETKYLLQPITSLTQTDIWCLSRFGFHYVAKAVEDLKTRKSNEPIRNAGAWLTSRCKEYQRKYG